MAKKVFNLFILDESGSMESIAGQTISSYNELIQTVKNSETRHPEQAQYITLVTFNGNGIKTVFDNAPIGHINGFTEKDYKPDATTPLWDAVGFSVTRLAQALTDEKDAVVLVSILTDGFENASQEFSAEQVKHLVQKYSANDWVFTFIGAGDDVFRQAAEIDIPRGNALRSTYTDLKNSTINLACNMETLHEVASRRDIKPAFWAKFKSNFFEWDGEEEE